MKIAARTNARFERFGGVGAAGACGGVSTSSTIVQSSNRGAAPRMT
jgi:hypothetical protein